MDTHLDDLIAAAAPPVAQRTPELRADLRSLVADTEAVAFPAGHRLGRSIGAISLAAVGVLGVGAAASATGLMPWFEDQDAARQSTTLSSGADCEVAYAARASEDPAHPLSPAEKAASLAKAQKSVRDFALSTISVDDAVRTYKAADAATRADLARRLPANEIAPKETADEIKILAVGAELNKQLKTELERDGLSPYAVSIAIFGRCDTESAQ